MAMLVSSLVDEVGEAYRTYTNVQESSTALTSTLSDSDLTFTVANPERIGVGLVQVSDEMMFVRSVDRTTSTVTLEPWGRAQPGSTAVAHSSGERVTASPKLPRMRIRDVIAGVLQEIFPGLHATADTLLTFSAAQVNYSLPADTYSVYAVEWQPTGPSLSWIPVRRWRQNKTSTTVELEILSRVQVGTDRVRVHYIKNPPTTLAFTDDLETMGYPAAIRDVIVLGAVSRLAAFTETSRIQTSSVESAARAENVPSGSAISLSRYLYQLFSNRLEVETRNHQMRFPIVLHFTR